MNNLSDWAGASNFGRRLRLAVRGESHSPRLEFRLENFPEGFRIDANLLRQFMERRAPGRDALSTSRNESDEVEFDSGVRDGVTTGEPICAHIANSNFRLGDYGETRSVPRPGHADFGQWIRFGRIPTGGGMNSGRLTATICAAGGICLQFLSRRGISIAARIEAIHGNADDPDSEITAAAASGDSVGGIVVCEARGLPPGIGGALFDGVESELSAALFGIPGVKGVEFGNGFAAAMLMGSENNDAFRLAEDGRVTTETNRHGGVMGGRTTGEPLTFRLAFKATPSIFLPQRSVDLKQMSEAELRLKGRHDPCIVRRAVPVVEAVAALVIADLLLKDESETPRICLTLTGGTLEENAKQFASERYFVDLVELRVDMLSSSERERVLDFPSLVQVPVVLTFRRKCDGGSFDGPEDERRDFFHRVLSDPRSSAFAYVDFEDDFRDAELTALASERDLTVIRSLHLFDGAPDGIADCCRRLRGDTNEIPKLAFMPRNLAEVERLFAETAELTDFPHVTLAMGRLGSVSRFLARRTHSFLTYASVGGLEELGQISPRELVATYRFRTPEADARLFGVTGFPLKHTDSPRLHNEAFAAGAIPAMMVDFPSASAAEALSLMKFLKMDGLAVTIPHKLSVMPLLDEIDSVAKEIGAVNTVVRKGDRLLGFNTDADGFSEALTKFLERERLDGMYVAVLGDGGAAQAVKFALARLGATYEVFHRRPLDAGFDVIVNATPTDPIPEYEFTGTEALFDLVYVPAETPLMARARAAGCKVTNGAEMLAAQARWQRKLWKAE